MKKLLLLMCVLLTGVSGAWADDYSVIVGGKVTDLSELSTSKYYILKSVGSSKYIYYDVTNSQMNTKDSYDYSCVVALNYDNTNVTIKQVVQNKYYQVLTGERLTLGDSPVNYTFNTDGLSSGQFRFANNSLYLNSNQNYWWPKGFNGTGDYSKWEIYEVFLIGLNKVYTLKAYFKSYTDLYFSNNNGDLAFNSSATNGVKDYWITRSSGNATYPWKLESGKGDGNFLSPKSGQKGLTTTGGWFKFTYCTDETTTTPIVHILGSKNADASTSEERHLATWNGSSKTGFADGGPSTGCFGGSHNNSDWSTDYIIEEVTGVDIYTVVCNIPSGGVTYNKQEYTGKADQSNGGFYIFASAPSAGNFTKKEVDNYAAGDVVVDASAKTITLNYTATITYTLTDANEKTYSWSASGTYGTAPTITGCAGHTISNEVWNEGSRTYTAKITFPFPISSNDVTNWTYIGSFSSNPYTSSELCWFVDSNTGNKVYTTQNSFPTNQSGEINRWEWCIEPSCTNGAFSFKIKNRCSDAANSYITMSASPSAGFSGQITLTSSGTGFTFDSSHRFKLPTATELYLSFNSNKGSHQEMGCYGPNGAHGFHYGNVVAFIEPADFTTLKANLKTAYNAFNSFYDVYNDLIAAGTYTETAPGSMASAHDNNTTVNNVIKDGATDYFTAAQFSTYTNTYNNAVNGVRYVMPTFFRVKNLDGSKYAKAYWRNYSDYIQLVFAADGTDASSIFYLNASNNIMSYYSGSYLFAINHTAPVGYFGYKCTYEFLPGSDVNQVYVHTVDNPLGWGGDNKYWSATDTQIDRVATPTANSDFLIEEVTSLPVTITAAKYATLCAPVALTIPSGVKAYYISDVTTTEATLTKLTGTIPADMPVILYADGLTETTTFDFPITTTDAFDGTNKLSGRAAAQNVAAGVAYTLQTASNEDLTVGFYPKAAGTIAGFRAYLLASQLPADVKSLKFRFDDADGINGLTPAPSPVSEGSIFNLAGQRMSRVQKGVNIVNGKKVLVK